MEDLLTTREVQELLKVDRITIYRMLQDGRLHGMKIGQQWRFPSKEVERLLHGQFEIAGPSAKGQEPMAFPGHCVQAIQNLFSELTQLGALTIDFSGNPLTEISAPCAFCQSVRSSAIGEQACRQSWQQLARQPNTATPVFTCHAGLQFAWAPIYENGEPVAQVLAGPCHFQPQAAQALQARLLQLARDYGLDAAQLRQAAAAIPQCEPHKKEQIVAWPQKMARAIESILVERAGFVNRLQRIAEISNL